MSESIIYTFKTMDCLMCSYFSTLFLELTLRYSLSSTSADIKSKVGTLVTLWEYLSWNWHSDDLTYWLSWTEKYTPEDGLCISTTASCKLLAHRKYQEQQKTLMGKHKWNNVEDNHRFPEKRNHEEDTGSELGLQFLWTLNRTLHTVAVLSKKYYTGLHWKVYQCVCVWNL